MIKNKLLLLACSLFIFGATSLVHAEEVKSSPETKTSHVKHVYKISPPVAIYVLEDGYSLYHTTKDKTGWKRGDKISVKDPFAEPFDETEVFVDAKNLTNNKGAVCLRLGWANPQPLAIVSTQAEKKGGFQIVTISLEDNTQWQFEYCDETPHAKFWKAGEKVLLFVDTHEPHSQNPFPLTQYLPKYSFDMLNLNSKHHFSGEPPQPLMK
jgi:hypothetical protein